jgi:enhancing lycopene biosynthesis protein 2
VRRRNRIGLDWDGAWRLDTGGPEHLDREVIDVSVRFAARIPVRPVRLIAEGCGLTRAGVERLVAEGKLVSAVRLSGRLSDDFTFTLKR